MAKARVPQISQECAQGIKRLEKVFISDVCILVAGGDYKLAGLLSQIIYWVTPNSDGISKLRIEHQGKLWIAKTNEAMAQESKLSVNDVKARKTKAIKMGYIEVKFLRFKGMKTTHIWVKDEFIQVVEACQKWVNKNTLPLRAKLVEDTLKEIRECISGSSHDHKDTTTKGKKRLLRKKKRRPQGDK